MLKIGWSQKDVSTTDQVCIPGQFYCRISKGILDPIMLSCLVMDDGEDCAIFLSGDFVSAAGVIDTIREKLNKKRNDIPSEKVLISATHTHDGPLVQKTNSYFDAPHDKVELTMPDKYREFMTDMAVEAVEEAWDNREEGSFSYGYGYAVVGHSRRVEYLDDLSKRNNSGDATYKSQWVDGHVKMYGKTNDDLLSGYEGGADHFINLLYTFNVNNELTGAVINVPCPSQNSENEWLLSASFWNEVRINLRKKYGNIKILPQCAAGGDTAPRILHYKEAQKRRFKIKYKDYEMDPRIASQTEMYARLDIAERICNAFDEVLSWCSDEKITDAPIKHTVKTIQLERRLISDEEYQFASEELSALEQGNYIDTGDALDDFVNNSKRACSMSRFRDIVKRYDAQKQSETAPMELHVIRIGDVAFATNAFELYQNFQYRIQARSPFMQTFIIQLCGQPDGYLGGYLATKRAVENKGYSATMYCNQISAKGGQTLVDETVAELKKLI